ncbi:hypothetical protein E4T50_07018 [Aureobasidium sp. EXF-12298]|nr:hypothetical protein E4T50_07018 [Aureobasidium sp. EXF-12298]KAI4759366.1 hypothetical protein E4T51_07580 [Aureobasidium sp. EXF-12344]KAI4776240.1 hypothetical protein E4T52_08799 [Aureobasidium sp. EXF-3400]
MRQTCFLDLPRNLENSNYQHISVPFRLHNRRFFRPLGIANIHARSRYGHYDGFIQSQHLHHLGNFSFAIGAKDKLPLKAAFNTAMGMSFISMLAMEVAENAVDYHLTGGVVALQDPRF